MQSNAIQLTQPADNANLSLALSGPTQNRYKILSPPLSRRSSGEHYYY